jgi:3-isopropylmalate/(R)-2-methylmalate dehydratase small subunit
VEKTESGDELEIDLASGKIKNLTRNLVFVAQPYPPFMAGLISTGGLANYTRKKLESRRNKSAI